MGQLEVAFPAGTGEVVKYRTIVVDPPWHYEADKTSGTWPPTEGLKPRSHDPMPYPTMTVAEIAALPVSSLAEKDAHLYLWTTQKHLSSAYLVVHAWGFSPGAVLVWSKPPKGISGTFVCSAEFVLFARRGTLTAKSRHIGTVFSWPRPAGHSTKPDAFLDVVEQVSPGPYLEMFARRARFGWDYWGDESLQTVELSA